MVEEKAKDWIPKTELGRMVMNGEIKSIDEIFKRGMVIREPEMVDFLIPDIESELIYTGGVPGKGGGKKRTALRITTRMHKSGRRRTIKALVVIGNKNGVVGAGFANGKDARTAIEKATRKAKLNLISIRRGCGSWECGCKNPHSIPFKVSGRAGSVYVELIPAPRGIRLCVADEAKKVMRLAGIKDLWMQSRGSTHTRVNFIFAVFKALSNLNKIKIKKDMVEATGLKEGAI